MIQRRPFLLGAAATGAGLAVGRRALASAADRMRVILDWLLNANHAALFAAGQCRAFLRAGLQVALVSPSDPDSPSRLIAAGQADLAVGYGSQINMIAAAGLPVLRVATLIDRPLNTVMALGDGPATGRGPSRAGWCRSRRDGVGPYRIVGPKITGFR